MSLIPSPFLRQALLADAVTSAACGLSMTLAAAALAGAFGLPETLLRIAGALLLPFAGLLAWISLRPRLPRLAVWSVVLANVLWALDSLLLLASGWVAPTAAGYAFVLAQAAVVLMYAGLQTRGLHGSRAVVA